MSFLTLNTLNDKLTHKTHYESIEQHKYARMATSSYYHDDQKKVEELFSKMEELKDFELDTQLSTQEHSIFHNKTTNETVIAYRGTTNLDDVKTDSHILMGREKNTERYKQSEDVFEKTKDKYGGDITTTGHSLGGGISLHISEKYDVKGHHFNPAISPTQVFDKDHYTNNSNQIIYRTKLDPVSIGGEIIADHQPNRTIVTVGNDENSHAHAMTNFYSDKAKRTADNKKFEVRKETLKTTIDRHKSAFKRLYDAYKQVQDIEEYLDSINSDADVFTKLPKALPKAIAMARRNADPHEYANETAKNLNPFFGFIPDPEYQWNDDDVISPLYHLGQAMRTRERRRQDRLINLGERSPHQQYTETDDHHLLSAAGVSYHEVMGQNMPRPTLEQQQQQLVHHYNILSQRTRGQTGLRRSEILMDYIVTNFPARRRPTEDYQVIDPSMMQGTSLSLTEGRLAEVLRQDPAVQRNIERFQDTGSRASDPMSSSYVAPSERRRRTRITPRNPSNMVVNPMVETVRNEIAEVLENPL